MTYNECDKTHHGVDSKENSRDVRMYAKPGDIHCPVFSLDFYLGKLSPRCTAFFQQALQYPKPTIWYAAQPIGKNKLASMMSRISEEAGLSIRYTNHCLRATVATGLKKSGVDDRAIMSVTGHRMLNLWTATLKVQLTSNVESFPIHFSTLMKHELVGVLRTEIVVYNLAAENSYMVFFTILVCLEANGTCSVNEVILNGRKIIKEVCDRSKGNEFSLAAWLEEKNLPKSGGILLDWAEVQLKQDLKIDQFLKTAPCYVYFFYNFNGCENADVKVTPADHYSSYSCIISENCQSVHCCVNLPTLNTKVTTVFRINQCRNNLRLEIDNLVHDFKLSEILYGNVYTFGLFGIVNIKYNIETPSLDTFSLTLNISVCMEPNNDCEFEIEIFKDVVVDQQSCDQAPGFLNPSFSLEDWLSGKKINIEDITYVTANDLMTELGLSDYMGWSNICDVNLVPYNGSVNGWNNECANITAPSIKLNESVACHITETCDRVTCCAEIPVLKRYIYASVNLRTCDYLLDVDLEENHFEFNLINYEWGKQENVQIHGVLQLVYAIHHIPSQKLFSMDMKIKACFEGNSSVCLYDYTVMENSQLLYSECDQTVERAPFKGISFDLWQPTECTLQTPTSCSIFFFSYMSDECSFTPDCQGITCCLPLKFINGQRMTSVTFHFISCTELEYSIERKVWQKSLEIGKVVTENIGDTFQYNYSLTSGFDPSLYAVTVDLQVCYLADGFCRTYILVNSMYIACPSTIRKKRRRRATTEPKVSDFKPGMRILMKRKASSKEIKEYIDKVKKYENNLVQQNLKGAVLPDTDTKTGSKSAMKALGWNNPATIPLSVDTQASESVTGGDVIQSMLGATFDIPGRTNHAFVVGQGLTNAGVRLLGQKLANMTIGDIENLLDVKNVDPVEVSKLIDELRDLFKALLSEFLTEIVGGDSDFFQSEDLDMLGEVPLPTGLKKVEFGSKMTIAAIVTLSFDNFLLYNQITDDIEPDIGYLLQPPASPLQLNTSFSLPNIETPATPAWTPFDKFQSSDFTNSSTPNTVVSSTLDDEVQPLTSNFKHNSFHKMEKIANCSKFRDTHMKMHFSF
ncbi:unnamed protein product [Mytilus coruscus]|uniref:Tyr recombinase domain-containing protein n=1 Tax=Mytilus coruscus TaxID=42192 RepID=A0A6J8CTE8_MYTCO|nr:unnamed protein product [Mytilus coruscus]